MSSTKFITNDTNTNTLRCNKADQVFKKAHQQMIEQCVGLLTGGKKIVQKPMKFELEAEGKSRYNKVFEFDISNDTFEIEAEDKKYQFSRICFLEDKDFQYEVSMCFRDLLPIEMFFEFYRGDKEGTFCIQFICPRY